MLACKVCQREFRYTGPKGPHYHAATCSKECGGKLVGIRNSSNRVHELVVSSCEVCGKETTNAITCGKLCHAKRLSILYTGRKLTEAWKKNQSVAKSRENIIKHGDFPCERCGKRFGTNLSLRAHRSYCTPPKEETNFLCEVCQKSFLSSRGLKIHSHSHDEEWNETRKSKIKIRAQSRKSQSTSGAELRFYSKLVCLFGIDDVVHKFKIDGCSHEYDFFIPSRNTIVEFDGDYWHGNKLIYELTPRMKKQFCLDRNWDENAIRAGYNIKRVWQSESEEIQLEQF